MNSSVDGWQLLAGWLIIILLVGGTVALLHLRHRRTVLPRPRPEHGSGADDSDRRRLRAELSQRPGLQQPDAGKPDAEVRRTSTGTVRVRGWLTTSH